MSVRPLRPARLAPALLLFCCSISGLVSCSGLPARAPTRSEVRPPTQLLGPSRQLTYEGRRTGEGYFSRDGRTLVFQSEREEGNPFYQIYTMDLQTGEVQRVSPGTGKTTCGWIHPSGRRVLFSSTHLDPQSEALQAQELSRRESGEQRRYEWDYDPHYDIFSVRSPQVPGDRPVRLTDAPGYDAEASWSPDGRFIVFASNREAYGPAGEPAASLSPADRERLAIDPSRFIDLYIMDSRGGGLRRLTEHVGYDGGPFFSPDGKRIVFRRFDPDGTRAEIFSMRTDGSDLKQLTRLDAMSWAPFYHPSGDYVVFTTNAHGFANFELYVVDAEGESAPVRVTQREGADLLPVFSPAGDELFYTRKPPSGQSQIHRAAWDDDLARRRLGLPARSVHGAGPLLPVPRGLSSEIQPRELRRLVEDLTNDATEGRLTGSKGERIATGYLARLFRALGLEPAGDGATYFHEFGFTAGVSLGPENSLRASDASGSRPLALDDDWRPLSFSRIGAVPESDVVFAGYGLVAPAGGDSPEVDDYAHLDVQDKWVIVLRYMPEGLEEAERRRLNRQSSLRYKAMVARDRGARGVLFVSGPESRVREELVGLRSDASLSGTSIAVLSLSNEAADSLIRAGSSRNLMDLQKTLDRGIALPGFLLEDVRLAGEIDIQQQRKKGRNVLARLPSSRKPAAAEGGAPGEPAPMLLIGAHLDHLGRGEASGSLARGSEVGQIHPGADDNASGVAALLEIAAQLAQRQRDGSLETHRDIVFAAWSGEELGLLGSAAWADDLLAAGKPVAAAKDDPHQDLSAQIAAYLNMDMVGRLRGHLTLLGVGSSQVWEREIERRNVPIGLSIVAIGDSYLPTDATTFYLKRVPILSAFTGSHEEYHTPRDRSEHLDYEGLAEISELMAAISASLATNADAPSYVAMARPAQGLPRAGLRVYLGTIPDYANNDPRPGLKLSGVTSGGPAEQAGLRAGDVIIRVGDRSVENIYDYTYALDGLEVGQPVKIVVRRGESQTAVMLTPASRD